MGFKFKNGKPLFVNGNPSLCCCAEFDCEYTVEAEITQSLDGSTVHIYGEIDGNAVVYYDNGQYPASPADDVIYWGSAIGAESITTGTAFTGGAHTFRFWWALADAGAGYPTSFTATITITTVSPSEICANGTTVNDGSPELVLDFSADEAPGDGDQSGFGGGFDLTIACGACP